MFWSFIDPQIALLEYFCVCPAECKRPVGGNIFPPQSLDKYPKNFDKIVHIWGYRQDGRGQNISELITFFHIAIGVFLLWTVVVLGPNLPPMCLSYCYW